MALLHRRLDEQADGKNPRHCQTHGESEYHPCIAHIICSVIDRRGVPGGQPIDFRATDSAGLGRGLPRNCHKMPIYWLIPRWLPHTLLRLSAAFESILKACHPRSSAVPTPVFSLMDQDGLPNRRCLRLWSSSNDNHRTAAPGAVGIRPGADSEAVGHKARPGAADQP